MNSDRNLKPGRCQELHKQDGSTMHTAGIAGAACAGKFYICQSMRQHRDDVWPARRQDKLTGIWLLVASNMTTHVFAQVPHN